MKVLSANRSWGPRDYGHLGKLVPYYVKSRPYGVLVSGTDPTSPRWTLRFESARSRRPARDRVGALRAEYDAVLRDLTELVGNRQRIPPELEQRCRALRDELRELERETADGST